MILIVKKWRQQDLYISVTASCYWRPWNKSCSKQVVSYTIKLLNGCRSYNSSYHEQQQQEIHKNRTHQLRQHFCTQDREKNCTTVAPKTRSIFCPAKMPNCRLLILICNNRSYKDYKLITKDTTEKLRENLDLRTTMSGRIWRTRKKSHVCLMVAFVLSMMLYGCAAMM